MTPNFKKPKHNFLDINIFTPIRYRIFLTVIFMSILVILVGIAINITLGLNQNVSIAFLVCLIISIIFFFIVKKSSPSKLDIYYYIFWIFIFISLAAAWFLVGGIDSSVLILFILAYISLFLTTKEKRTIALLISITFIVSLILLDYFFPELITRFDNKSQRIIYLVKTSVVYLVFIHFLLEFLTNQNKIEKQRLELVNKKLDASNQEINYLNKKLELLVKELKAANNSKDSFISIVAHDLRSPFQGLLGVSRLLNENFSELKEDEKIQLLKKLNNLLENQYRFLEELLLWGRLQKNAISIKYENFSLKELLLFEVNHFKEIINQKKLNVIFCNSSDYEINTDRNLLSTVLRNIISNAIKFSPIGQKIEISFECENTRCSIKIKDYGLGISEEDLQNLFKPDVKVTRKGTEGETGSGFGLMICSEIMQKLNGEISIESKEGAGTTVTITLPIIKS